MAGESDHREFISGRDSRHGQTARINNRTRGYERMHLPATFFHVRYGRAEPDSSSVTSNVLIIICYRMLMPHDSFICFPRGRANVRLRAARQRLLAPPTFFALRTKRGDSVDQAHFIISASELLARSILGINCRKMADTIFSSVSAAETIL